MRSKLALALATAALLAACGQSPTASNRPSAPRYDGGSTLGSGHVTTPPDTSAATETTSTTPGGNGLGSGH